MLEAEKNYHIFNRGNNREIIFPGKINYDYFLEKYKKYCAPIFESYSYCLIPNHFHFIIKVKGEAILTRIIKSSERPSFIKYAAAAIDEKIISTYLSREINNFFVAYAKAINSQEGRVGSLFQKHFKHPEIIDENYLQNAILYVHMNPVHHHLTERPEDWPYSSFHDYIDQDRIYLGDEIDLALKVKEGIALFDGIDNFKFLHQQRAEALMNLKFDDID